jgi:hypothetical protein
MALLINNLSDIIRIILVYLKGVFKGHYIVNSTGPFSRFLCCFAGPGGQKYGEYIYPPAIAALCRQELQASSEPPEPPVLMESGGLEW